MALRQRPLRPAPDGNGAADLYTSVDRVGATDAVVQRIEDLIVRTTLRPGDPLPPEREFAAQLGVSRNILREALKILSQKGLVRVISGRGAFVDVPTTQALGESLALLLQLRQVSVLDLCDVRLLIEPELASLAAARATDADIEELQRWLDRLHEARADAAAHVEADLAFHGAIARTARHSVLQPIVEAVRAPVTHSMQLGTRIPRAIDASDGHHRAIFAAIKARDPAAAQAAMWGHMAYVQSYIRRLEESGGTTEG